MWSPRITRRGAVARAALPLLLAAVSGFAAADRRGEGAHRQEAAESVPPVVQPSTYSTARRPGRAPSDAVVLFDGTNLAQWRANDGSSPVWRLENGAVEVVRGTGMLWTRADFGDCQLHVEWAAPASPSGSGQERGNSGIYLMGRYEVQILDSYENPTYPDGQAAAVYGQFAPLVNAALPPGEWQSYDIVFHGPRFDAAGGLLRPARVTVLHNGVLVQDGVELTGPTGNGRLTPYQAHPERLPLGLQDHGDAVRFRNIWIRELVDAPGQATSQADSGHSPAAPDGGRAARSGEAEAAR
jgi:hypothetical protein